MFLTLTIFIVFLDDIQNTFFFAMKTRSVRNENNELCIAVFRTDDINFTSKQALSATIYTRLSINMSKPKQAITVIA